MASGRGQVVSQLQRLVDIVSVHDVTFEVGDELSGSPLPIGLHVMCAANADARLLSIARAIENLLGTGPLPDLGGFL